MELFHYVFLFMTLGAVRCETCDHLGVLLYEDLGCTPHYSESSSCPVKYTCKGLSESSEHCYFRGKSYRNKESVDEELLDPSCDRACTCTSYRGKSSFNCAVLDCPEWLGVQTNQSCYRTYSLNECCAVGQVCPPYGDVARCVVDGKEYREGEQFYPKDTCQICVCQKGFKGKFEEPFCRKWSCGVQLKNSGEDLKKGCAPWYYDSAKGVLCCPNNWICPDGTEEIKGNPVSDDVCIFGERTLKVGQAFEKFNIDDNFGKIADRVKCECVIPPLLTCVHS